MYKIIGGDQKEYGPVTADELRRWISEGRLSQQSLVRAEGDNDWRPLSAYPEFGEALAAQVGGPASGGFAGATGAREWSSAEILARRPQVQVGQCLALSWKLLKSNFSLLFCGSFLVWLVLLVQFIPVIGGVLYLLGCGVLYGGLYLVAIKRIRGRPASIGDVFGGFSLAFGQLMLAGFLTGLLTGVGMCCCMLPGIYLLVAWTFSVPLVADRGLEFWSAMELSRKVVTRVWFKMFGLLIVAFLPSLIYYVVSQILISSTVFSAIQEMMAAGGQPDVKRMIETIAQVAKESLPLVILGKFILLLNLPFAVGALMYAYENLFGTRPPTAP